jgi:H2-forming N5,N10-methylenetetrahydromethanopterin dehydrogenase-like enzyme
MELTPTWPQIAIALITLATLIYQYVKEGRRRAWEKEDRAEKEALAIALLHEKEDLALRLNIATATLDKKLDENTQMNKEALAVANNFTERLAESNKRWDALGEAARIEGVAETQTRVREIHEEVVHDAEVR